MNSTLIGALRRLDDTRLRGEFYRAWEVGLRNKLSSAAALDQMGPQKPAPLEEARRHLVQGLLKGRPVTVLVRLRPELFPPLDSALLIAGDGYGTLRDSLRLLSEYYVRDFTRMSRVRGLTGVPIVAGIVASFVLPFPLLWDVGAHAYSAAILACVVALYALGGIPVSLYYSVVQSLPLISRPRFATTLAYGLEAGLTFAGAIRLAAEVSGLRAIGRHIAKAPDKQSRDMKLAALLEGCPAVWPAMLEHARKADEIGDYLSSLRVFAETLEAPK
jgi:type II secretory pathway component PulF